MEQPIRTNADRDAARTVEGPPGIFRTTLVYNDDIMLCHFLLTNGAEVPLHRHPAVQSGYVISGRLRFRRGEGGRDTFLAGPGSGYLFRSNELHGAEVLEEAEAVDCFTPPRPDYLDA
jgi:quercetin dioxygenase-like cupin family protein